jgi:hypothetical protein
MWNRKHNSNIKTSAHTFIRNWKVVNLPIKVHPSAEYCNSGGIECQYLRYKDVEKKQPYCAWNLEYRGRDMGNAANGEPSTKGPLQIADKTGFVLKARFCRDLGESYYNSVGTWENTLTINDPPDEDE